MRRGNREVDDEKGGKIQQSDINGKEDEGVREDNRERRTSKCAYSCLVIRKETQEGRKESRIERIGNKKIRSGRKNQNKDRVEWGGGGGRGLSHTST